MKWQEFKEQELKTMVFTYGRFNPPTIGHKKLIDRVIAVAQKYQGDYKVYSGKTQDPKKNPLTLPEKIFFLEQLFPGININKDASVRTPFEALESIGKDYDRAILVVGSDRIDAFKAQMQKYVSEFGLKEFDVISAGERDPDADDISGMSASKARQLAADGDIDAFKTVIPGNEKLSTMLYNKVRQGMNVNEGKMKDILTKKQEKDRLDKLDQGKFNWRDVTDVIFDPSDPLDWALLPLSLTGIGALAKVGVTASKGINKIASLAKKYVKPKPKQTSLIKPKPLSAADAKQVEVLSKKLESLAKRLEHQEQLKFRADSLQRQIYSADNREGMALAREIQDNIRVINKLMEKTVKELADIKNAIK